MRRKYKRMFKKKTSQLVGTRERSASFLLIGQSDSQWRRALDDASKIFGNLRAILPTMLHKESTIYDCYILDDAHIPNVPALIRKIRRRHPNARVVVVSDNPSWENARAAFRVGAIDYVQRENDCRGLRKTLSEILQKRIGAGCA